MITKKLSFSIVTILITLFLISTSYAALSKNQHNKNTPNWYKLGFFVNFNGVKISSSRLDIYSNPDDIIGTTLDNVLTPISSKLKQQIFSSKTINPFRVLFPNIYQAQENKLMQHCDFMGMKFELDDNTNTKEWLISFPAEKCIYANKAMLQNDYSELHSWIIQSNSQGIYTVLMQSEGLVYIIKNPSHAYKNIETQLFNQHMHRDNTQSCGYGIISWNYQDGKYRPQRLYPKINGCESTFPETGENSQQRESNMLVFVEQLLLDTLQKLVFHDLFINDDHKLQRLDEH